QDHRYQALERLGHGCSHVVNGGRELTICSMTHKSSAEDVLLFWFGAPPERGKAHKQWFVKDEAFDREVRSRFLGLHEDAADGKQRCDLERTGRRLLPADGAARSVSADLVPRHAARLRDRRARP